MQRLTWIAAACAFSASVLGVTAWAIVQDRAETRARAKIETASIARLLATQAQVTLGSVQEALGRAEGIMQALRQERLTSEQARDRLHDMVTANPAIGTIWAVRHDGSSWIDNTNPAPRSAGVTQRRYFQVHRDGERQFVGPVETGTVQPRPRMTVSVRLADEERQFAGVLVAGIDAAHFLTLLTNARFAPGLSASLSTEQGVTLLATDGRPPDRSHEIIASSQMFSPPGIRLDVERDMTMLMDVWRQRAALMVLFAMTVCGLFLALSVFGYRLAVRERAARQNLEQLTATLEERVERGKTELRVMFMELKHRVKNNLAVVLSLLHLQRRAAGNLEVRKALATVEGRIGVIADLYRDLESDQTAEFDAAVLVRQVATKLATVMQQEDVILLQIGSQPVIIRSEYTVPLGLFLNEALTNAFKHTAGGTVTVNFSGAEGMFSLSVANPFEQRVATDSGQGSRIMQALARQLGGELSVTDDGRLYTVALEVRDTRKVSPAGPVLREEPATGLV